MSTSYPFEGLVAAPGQSISIGAPTGGNLLISPPGNVPGQMTLTDLQNRTWHLLREPGPDTGQPAPTLGDFNITVVTRDLNIAFADFVSQTGIAPGLTERQVVKPVYPVLDMPVPADMLSLAQIEYTPAGQQTYSMIGLNFEEWKRKFGTIQPVYPNGNPYYYRTPFAGYIRCMPVPNQANFVGPGTGIISITGNPTVGQVYFATLQNPPNVPVITASNTVGATDTPSTMAFNLSTAINTSPAVQGATAFFQPTQPSSNTIQLTALTAPGTTLTYFATISGAGATITPSTATALNPNGDSMTWYYTSVGNLLELPGDTPRIPPQFQMSLVYRVLADYWLRKGDRAMAKDYMDRFDLAVARGKAFTFDSERSTQPTTAGVNDDDDYVGLGYPT